VHDLPIAWRLSNDQRHKLAAYPIVQLFRDDTLEAASDPPPVAGNDDIITSQALAQGVSAYPHTPQSRTFNQGRRRASIVHG
jgi:hypothetical protein